MLLGECFVRLSFGESIRGSVIVLKFALFAQESICIVMGERKLELFLNLWFAWHFPLQTAVHLYSPITVLLRE